MAVTEFRDHLLRIARNEPILIHCEAAESIADCVLNLADENATLRAQLAEAVALLGRSPMLYRCISGSMGQDFCDSRDGGICSDHARRVFLAKLNTTSPPRDWTDQPDGMPVDDAKLEAAQNLAAAVLKSGPRESESRPPEDESGRTAAAVIPPAIPDGFALAPGHVAAWLRKKSDERKADFDGHSDEYIEGAGYALRMAARLIEAGALVPLVPAEPSGTPTCEPWCGKPYLSEGVPGCKAGLDTPPFVYGWGPVAYAFCSRRCIRKPAPAPQPEAPADSGMKETPWTRREDTAFFPAFGTVRACIDCGALIAGGPTRCLHCARETKHEPLPAEPPSDAVPCFAESMNLRCDVHSPAPSEPAKARTYVCDLCNETTDTLEGGRESGPPENFWACAKCAPGLTGKETSEPAPAPLSAATLRATWRQAEDRIADLEARLGYTEKRCREIRSTRDEALKAAIELRRERFDLTAKLVACVESRTCAECGGPTAISDLQCSNCYDRDITAAEKAADARVAEERARVNYWWNKWRTGASLSWEDRDLAIASGAPAPAVKP